MIFMVSSDQGIICLIFCLCLFVGFYFLGFCLACLFVSTNDKKRKTKRPRIRRPSPYVLSLVRVYFRISVFSCLANPSSFFSRMNFLAHTDGWIIPLKMGHLIPLLSDNSLLNLNGVTQFEGNDSLSSMKKISFWSPNLFLKYKVLKKRLQLVNRWWLQGIWRIQYPGNKQ